MACDRLSIPNQSTLFPEPVVGSGKGVLWFGLPVRFFALVKLTLLARSEIVCRIAAPRVARADAIACFLSGLEGC